MSIYLLFACKLHHCSMQFLRSWDKLTEKEQERALGREPACRGKDRDFFPWSAIRKAGNIQRCGYRGKTRNTRPCIHTTQSRSLKFITSKHTECDVSRDIHMSCAMRNFCAWISAKRAKFGRLLSLETWLNFERKLF